MVKGSKRCASTNDDEKWKSETYQFSAHDNRYTLRGNIGVFANGLGRRKFPDDRRQHNSHFSLAHEGAVGGPGETTLSLTAYQTDYEAKQGEEAAASKRRFPHNHQRKSMEAAAAQAAEQFMWFGLAGGTQTFEPLELLAATK
ncbi:testis-expressed protein 36 [Lampris incognitus]|uniref:testis-expressed protein 36 n=1 Tax=Lampris incognitus TaxID=2546036 RepID=UPI0024B4A7FF|nr:testis-expressed protein 36 [Lampris incognitus]